MSLSQGRVILTLLLELAEVLAVASSSSNIPELMSKGNIRSPLITIPVSELLPLPLLRNNSLL
jgi:hypothetical protein